MAMAFQWASGAAAFLGLDQRAVDVIGDADAAG
jgi:hypothetical protein